MANEIDLIMDLDPLDLSKTPGGIDAIIAYHRNNRANAEAGIKPKKETGPKLSLDLGKLGLSKPKPPITRRA